jgi:aspartate oxidase
VILLCAVCLTNDSPIRFEADTVIDGTSFCTTHANEYVASKAIKQVEYNKAIEVISNQLDEY